MCSAGLSPLRGSPCPRAWQLGAGSKGLSHGQREGSCQLSGSLAVAAVGSLLFSCFALACRLGLLLSSALVKAVGSSETFASHQQAAAHSSQPQRALGWWCSHGQGRMAGESWQAAHSCVRSAMVKQRRKQGEDALVPPHSGTCVYGVSLLQLLEMRKRQR